ncbi:hypothetical protein HF324_31965 [Chitinophaga oryzae]|uniref:Uncharacterized protein n=1 Tax=Chitinophaga oryzae TaxID=2725414 RepID=A0ABX6LQ16_9BACT|nr:hypothetical protein [Chitinophaga oryzae]QJB42208.1 hypothetical protein HF324_31965 [Chitinophaga oryzae]
MKNGVIQVIDNKDYSEALGEFKEAYAQIWTFHISLKRLVIRLSFTKQKEVLYILAAGCEHVQGVFSWEKSDLTIENASDNTGQHYLTRIFDRNSLFELQASGGVVLFYGSSDDLWWTLDELKIDGD